MKREMNKKKLWREKVGGGSGELSWWGKKERERAAYTAVFSSSFPLSHALSLTPI